MTGAMNSDEPQETGWRGSREVWLDGALALLVEGGIDAVRIQPLSKRLRIARTSFYWHFSDRETLLAALSDRWVARSSDPMVAACAAFAETETEAMLNLISCFLSDASFDSRLEFAIRSWALQDPAMMARLNDEDERRLAALIAMFHRWGHAALDAETRARAVYLTQIGYIAMQQREDLAIRMARIPAYVQIFTGTAPEARELARFHARHDFVPG
jgi:AcrR family transcriptional regulator